MLDRNPDLGRLILRLSVAGMMLLHGIHKLSAGVGSIERNLEGKGLPALIAYGVYIGEVVAPILVIAGFRARLAAAVVAFNMVVAVGLSHAGDVFELTRHGGWAIELQMLYALGAVAIFFFGAGRYAISSGNRWD